MYEVPVLQHRLATPTMKVSETLIKLHCKNKCPYCVYTFTPQSTSYENDEAIYVAPASDEHSLYSQLSQIRIHEFPRDTIKSVGS